MQRHTIKATNLELTDAIRDYVHQKLDLLEKVIEQIDPMGVRVEVEKTTNHHNKGKLFRCEMNINVKGGLVRVEKTAEDLYKAIDKVKDHLHVELSELKKKWMDKSRRLPRPGKDV